LTYYTAIIPFNFVQAARALPVNSPQSPLMPTACRSSVIGTSAWRVASLQDADENGLRGFCWWAD